MPGNNSPALFDKCHGLFYLPTETRDQRLNAPLRRTTGGSLVLSLLALFQRTVATVPLLQNFSRKKPDISSVTRRCIVNVMSMENQWYG